MNVAADESGSVLIFKRLNFKQKYINIVSFLFLAAETAARYELILTEDLSAFMCCLSI